MHPIYLAVTLILAAMAAFSGAGKIRKDPRVVKIVCETVGVPHKYLGWLAALELTGAVGLVGGIRWPPLGVAAGIGLVLYFLGAVISHVRAGDFKGIGPAAFLLILAAGAVALRMLDAN